MITIVNIMKDGSICEDLSTYLDDHKLPEDAARLMLKFIRDGRAAREKKEAAEG